MASMISRGGMIGGGCRHTRPGKDGVVRGCDCTFSMRSSTAARHAAAKVKSETDRAAKAAKMARRHN